MTTDTRKLVLGAVALSVGSVLIFAVGILDTPLPDGPVAAVAALALAAGALLVGLSEIGTGV
ncbi:uncharacterized protein Nmlp_3711 [Natronomonas moolapensis 8.8.11]|jgi:hypothetical protein|uniref:Uncharacterized protein n=1 Tax=Natronomonas moolapensis (strain DSM 18674 / CECT 7526 / JCM 14361 / 8.8.11) TaxID=268739 RepID=M1XTQ7_NATM8|nr:hypothetical protein [Natronomonas moolapensis]CCQ37825.1 uncharacterized protein Nmlp_3711 [Natronomonas moolapensis 8.8.11]